VTSLLKSWRAAVLWGVEMVWVNWMNVLGSLAAESKYD
jgi:hypothetical protein